MSAKLIVAALLADSTITALVSTRRALQQLPQNSAMPALVYNIIDEVPHPNIAYQNGAQRAVARVQINPLALTIGEVESIHAAVRSVMDFVHRTTVATRLVVSCRVELVGLTMRDNDAGLWTQPVDYLLDYYE